MKESIKYQPGVSNIGKKEIQKRKHNGWYGLVATLVLWTLSIFLDIDRAWRLLLFIPAVLSASGFLQAKMKFCLVYGIKGVFNVSSNFDKTEIIQYAEYLKKDKRKAWQIIIYSVIIGLCVAILGYYL